MIILPSGYKKDIFLRLNTTLDNSNYLFVFTNNDVEDHEYSVVDEFTTTFTLPDLSSNSKVYNKFQLDPLDYGLEPGSYDVKVYEVDEGEATRISLLYVGYCKVEEQEEEQDEVHYYDDDFNGWAYYDYILWILEFGYWNDEGVWEDSDFWKDE